MPSVNTSASERRMVLRMALRKKVAAKDLHDALEHAKRNGVNLSAITTGRQMNVLEELLLALARGNSTASVVEKFKAVDAATSVPLLGKRQPVVPDVVVVEPDLSQELKVERIEHVKAIETSLVLVKVAKTAQEEVASLKKQLKVAKMQYSQWADKTEEALDKSKAEVKMLVADGKTLIDRVAAEQAKVKAAQKEVELYVALLNDAEKKVDYSEMRLNIVSDKYVSQLYDAETEIGTLKAEAGELKTEKIALKALLNAERLKNKMLVESLSKGLAMFEQPPLDNGVQQAAPPDSPWTIFLNGNA